MMLSWEIGIRTGWEKSVGSKGKHLESFLSPDLWNEYKRTYVDSDYDNLWESLFLFHSIFRKTAEFVAEKCGFRFPQETSEKVLAFLEHVRKLPPDAQSIYSGDDEEDIDPGVLGDDRHRDAEGDGV